MTVAISKAPKIGYGDNARIALRQLFLNWRLDEQRAGTSLWNPMGDLVRDCARVTIKPNWVFHVNQSGEPFGALEEDHANGNGSDAGNGLDCLVTHPDIIDGVLDYVGRLRPERITVGDAPVQGCDFKRLREVCGLDEIAGRHGGEVSDFRRTVMAPDARGLQREDQRDLSHFVLFDLGPDSLIEGLGNYDSRLRVTMYNPDLLGRTHASGRHQYLIAREILEADLVVNLPKLKSHMKAGVTGALKNLIGINGNKEFLPHHRKGGSKQGGDCYEGYTFWKSCAEDVLDHANRRSGGMAKAALSWSARKMLGADRLAGSDGLVEGAWYGNDTVWRTALDLNRILIYGRPDGSMANEPQRTILHITDAILGGEGEGPLRPAPAPSGFLTGSLNAAAAEWVNVRAMGWDPMKIPLVREAFGRFRWPLAEARPEDIRVLGEAGAVSESDIVPPHGHQFTPSAGWQGHVEQPWQARTPALKSVDRSER